MFTLFMFLVLVAWLVPVAPAARDLGRLIGKPPGASLLAWFVAGLMGHDDVAEEINPRATWAASKVEARAATGWAAAFTWAAANPGPVLAGVAGLAALFWLPDVASLGAIVLVRGLPGTRPATWCTWRTRSRRPGSSSPTWTWTPSAQVFVCPPVPGRLGVHGVPQATWDRMAARWESHPGEFRLDPQGVPCVCAECGRLRPPGHTGFGCVMCSTDADSVFPWAGPGNYFRSNGQASVSLGQCDTPDELTHELRESQGTADWRGWTVSHSL